MIKLFLTILLFSNSVSFVFSQGTCENNCGSGSLTEYFAGNIDCVCSLDCAGYGSACCDYYDECYENPASLTISDFVGTWHGNITNDQTWSYDDPISINIESNGQYAVINNPGGHLVSNLYPGTEQVLYNSSTNILTFRWVNYYHYSCGGACYSGVYFQVMDLNNGNLTLFYNNGSGPAPQANSLFLSLEGFENDCVDGEVDNSNPCNPMECWDGQWFEIIIDCSEQMGIPCENGLYIPPPDGVCCSECILLGDLNQDGSININDIILSVNVILGTSHFNELSDLNQDGSIDVVDVIQIVNIILNN